MLKRDFANFLYFTRNAYERLNLSHLRGQTTFFKSIICILKTESQCLKIIENVSFKVASEAS